MKAFAKSPLTPMRCISVGFRASFQKCFSTAGPRSFGNLYPDHKRWVPHCPDFLRRLVALTHFMRLSLMKGAHADLSSTAWQEIGVKPSVGLNGIPRSLTARPQWGEKLLGKTKRPVTVANKVITPPVAAPSPPVPAAPPPLPAAQRSLLPSEPYSSPSQRTRQPSR
jgi:hypothetical protein